MDQRKELAAADDNFGVMAELLRSTKRRRNCRESRIIIFPTQIACIGGTGQMRSGLRKKPKNGGAASGNPENSPDAAERYYCDAGLYEAPDSTIGGYSPLRRCSMTFYRTFPRRSMPQRSN